MLRFFIVAVVAFVFAQPAFAAQSAYDFSFKNFDGGEIKLSQYKGKVVLVVNTATECGNTHQLGSLQSVWKNYGDKGLVVVAVPSNDFGQEPRKGKAIAEFCETNFNTDFPMADLTSVRGEKAHPFFKWAVAELGSKSAPSWNFFKYLVGRDGKLIDYFGTVDDPMKAPLLPVIEKALK